MHRTAVDTKALKLKEKVEKEKCEGQDRFVWEKHRMIDERLKCSDEERDQRREQNNRYLLFGGQSSGGGQSETTRKQVSVVVSVLS